MSMHNGIIEHVDDLIIIKVPANIKARDKLSNRVFVRRGVSFLMEDHTLEERK
jgi:hypothetical protein